MQNLFFLSTSKLWSFVLLLQSLLSTVWSLEFIWLWFLFKCLGHNCVDCLLSMHIPWYQSWENNRHSSRYCAVAFCYVHKCELSYMYVCTGISLIMHLYFGILFLNIFTNLLHIAHSPLLHIVLLYLPYPLSNFTLNLIPFFFSNHSLLSLFAPTVIRSLAIPDPAHFFISLSFHCCHSASPHLFMPVSVN